MVATESSRTTVDQYDHAGLVLLTDRLTTGALWEKLQQCRRVTKFLMGLNESYESACRHNLMLKPILPIEEVFNMLTQDERQKSIKSAKDTSNVQGIHNHLAGSSTTAGILGSGPPSNSDVLNVATKRVPISSCRLISGHITMADVVKMSLVSSKEDVAKWPDESAARRDQRRESPSISNQTKAPPAFVDTKLQEYPIENDEPEASVKESQHLRFDSFGFGMHSGLPSGFLNDDDYPFNYLNTRDGEYHEEEEQRLWNNVANDQTEPTQADQSHVWYHHGSVNKLDVIRAASKADRAPGRLRVTPVTVANMQIIRVAAVGISKFGTSIAILFGSFVIQKKKITVKDSTKQGDHVDDSDRLCTFIFGSLPRPPEARCVFLFQPSSSRGRMSVSSLFLTSSDSA